MVVRHLSYFLGLLFLGTVIPWFTFGVEAEPGLALNPYFYCWLVFFLLYACSTLVSAYKYHRGDEEEGADWSLQACMCFMIFLGTFLKFAIDLLNMRGESWTVPGDGTRNDTASGQTEVIMHDTASPTVPHCQGRHSRLAALLQSRREVARVPCAGRSMPSNGVRIVLCIL